MIQKYVWNVVSVVHASAVHLDLCMIWRMALLSPRPYIKVKPTRGLQDADGAVSAADPFFGAALSCRADIFAMFVSATKSGAPPLQPVCGDLSDPVTSSNE